MKISIIMPVYNAARYVSAALDSVLAQDFTDWECVCVDDGSTDGSGVILDGYAERDSRIKVFHQKNVGEGAARNAALVRMTGALFTCLDADDVLLPNSLSDCSKVLEETGCDAVCCVPLMLSFRDTIEFYARDVRVALVADRMALLWGGHGSYGFVSGRIYRTDKFGHLRFPVGMKMCADAWHWIDALMVPAKWCTINRPMIGYRQVSNSASNTFDAEFNRCILKAFAHTCQSLRAMDYNQANPMHLFWARNGAIIKSHLRLMFRDWKTFSKEDRADLARRAKDIVAQMGYNPFSWDMRLRIAALDSVSDRVILPTLGLICDWLWPRIKNRLPSI